MHAHNTRLNAAVTDLLIQRHTKTPEAVEAVKTIQADLNIVENVSGRTEQMIIATRIFKKVIESAPHLMWQHPRFKSSIQSKVNEFMKDYRNNIYKDIDEHVRKEFMKTLFTMQSIC
jgi:hypothetical protein